MLLWDIFKLFFPPLPFFPASPSSSEPSGLPVANGESYTSLPWHGAFSSPQCSLCFFPLIVWVSCQGSLQGHITHVPQLIVGADADAALGSPLCPHRSGVKVEEQSFGVVLKLHLLILVGCRAGRGPLVLWFPAQVMLLGRRNQCRMCSFKVNGKQLVLGRCMGKLGRPPG